MFESEAMQCRHVILFVLNGRDFNEIPSHYIVNRWMKLATTKPVFDYDGNLFEACSKFENGRT